MVSFGASGKSKNKSKNESKTVFPKDFFNQAYGYFGRDPGYDPQYVGLEGDNFDKLEDNLYYTQKARTDDAYKGALNLQNEDLSNMGLINSPAKFIEGGARDTLNKNYISSLQQAARDASMQRFGLQQKEAERETGFNVDLAKTLLQSFMNKLLLAGQAGRESTGTSSGSGWNAGLSIFSSGGGGGGTSS